MTDKIESLLLRAEKMALVYGDIEKADELNAEAKRLMAIEE